MTSRGRIKASPLKVSDLVGLACGDHTFFAGFQEMLIDVATQAGRATGHEPDFCVLRAHLMYSFPISDLRGSLLIAANFHVFGAQIR